MKGGFKANPIMTLMRVNNWTKAESNEEVTFHTNTLIFFLTWKFIGYVAQKEYIKSIYATKNRNHTSLEHSRQLLLRLVRH